MYFLTATTFQTNSNSFQLRNLPYTFIGTVGTDNGTMWPLWWAKIAVTFHWCWWSRLGDTGSLTDRIQRTKIKLSYFSCAFGILHCSNNKNLRLVCKPFYYTKTIVINMGFFLTIITRNITFSALSFPKKKKCYKD